LLRLQLVAAGGEPKVGKVGADTREGEDENLAAERARALDPLQVLDPESARAIIEVAGVKCDRRKSALEQLQKRFAEVQDAEEENEWNKADSEIAVECDAAANDMTRIPKILDELVGLLQRAEVIDQKIADLHGWAPAGESRRLLRTELVARNLLSFSRDEPSFARDLKLPDWHNGNRLVWPPPKTPLAVMVAESMTPPPDPRFSADWAAPRERENARRKQEGERRAQEETERQAERRRTYEASLRQ
jgi:hypothetical protein